MATKADLQEWTIQALLELGGSGSVLDVCKQIWRTHEAELGASGDLYYTWQYDVRWAASTLRAEGRMRPAPAGGRGPWVLNRPLAS